jgi:hypothetical protein
MDDFPTHPAAQDNAPFREDAMGTDGVWMWTLLADARHHPPHPGMRAFSEYRTWTAVLRPVLQEEGANSGLEFWFAPPHVWWHTAPNSVNFLVEPPPPRPGGDHQTDEAAAEEFDRRCVDLCRAARWHLDRHGFGHYAARVIVVATADARMSALVSALLDV